MGTKSKIRALDAQHTSGMTPDDAATYLNDTANGGTVNTELDPAMVTRTLQDANELVPIQLAATDSGHAAHSVALQGATLLRTARDYGMQLKLWSGTTDRAAFDALVSAGLISQPVADSITDQAVVAKSLAAAAGLGEISQFDVLEART